MRTTTLAQTIGFTRDQAAALIDAGCQLHDAGDHRGAEAIFRGVLVLNPYDAQTRSALGAVLQAAGDFAAAEAEFLHALEDAPGTPLAVLGLGELKLRRGVRPETKDLEALAADGSEWAPRARELLRVTGATN
jgi:Flp pilus assembly protein TadD